MLERHEIETFLILAEELHFGRTATRLRVTTGRVSQTVKKIERRIGAALFERTSRTVNLTPIGRQLAADLGPIVSDMEKALRRAVTAGRGVEGVLRVGFMGAAAGQLVSKALNVFGPRHPECAPQLVEVGNADVGTLMREGEVDVLVAARPFPGVVLGPVLMTEPRVLAVPAAGPLAAEEFVPVAALTEHPVLQLSTQALHGVGVTRQSSCIPEGEELLIGPSVSTFSEMLTMVGAGRGVVPVGAHVASYHPRPDIAYVPFCDSSPVEWGPVWLEANETERVRAFVRAAVDANAPVPEPVGADRAARPTS
ncbi:LysR family transcriptional regulator [Glycomyces tenuis]|uniref:LysR family transcriptional regulator n=1 Tax=Glycomyces tenuis TaxID=58116 RepID=UPI000403D9AF|nr:LysR family transcriptional regulator [Glycomyces tenuis]